MDDDEEWDRWMALTEAEQDAEMAAVERALEEVTRELSLSQLAARYRCNYLKLCLSWRRHITQEFIPNVAREHLRHCQVELLKVRIYRRTGQWPGEA